ncbi:MAG: DNA repair protein RadA [bacterium]|nr:DNA repair protein RadA [bacterium]
MAKSKTVYSCTECGFQTSRWLGQCPECKNWNTFVEETVVTEKKNSRSRTNKLHSSSENLAVGLDDVQVSREHRTKTGIEEFDRILGGGIFQDSLILIGGEPGIGKSTLILQIADRLSKKGKKVLYISGEESPGQLKDRSNRLGIKSSEIFLLSEIEMKKIESAITTIDPSFIIIDSIQTIYFEELESIPGSVSQIRETTARLMYIAKNLGKTIFIIGHITKGGIIAGPRILEHMVDTVLYFEGDRDNYFRLLRSIKNRFGTTNEIGIFEMTGNGLEEVKDISGVLISDSENSLPGVALSSAFEGSRALVMEIQSLVSPTSFGMPRRLSTGIDFNRFTLMIAIIEKKLHLPLQTMDVFINITGGIKVIEPAVDLAVLTAIVSAFKDQAFPEPTIVLGEVGLNGEIRPVSRIEDRVKAAHRQGYNNFIVPLRNKKSLGNLKGENLKINYVKYVSHIFQHLK